MTPESLMHEANAYFQRAAEHTRDGENAMATECMAHFHRITNEMQRWKPATLTGQRT